MSLPRASLCTDPPSAYKASPRVLVVDCEREVQEVLTHFLGGLGLHVSIVTCANDAFDRMQRESFDLIIADLMLPEQGGLQLIRYAKAHAHPTRTLVMQAGGSIEAAVDAMQNGAAGYVTKPLDLELLRHRIRRALAASPELLEAPKPSLTLDTSWANIQKALADASSREHQLALIEAAAREKLGDVRVHLTREPSVPGAPSLQGGFLEEGPTLQVAVVCQGRIRGQLSCFGTGRTQAFLPDEKMFVQLLASQAGLIFEAATLEESQQAVAAQTLQALARALEAKDMYTFGHSDRVAFYAAQLAKQLCLGDATIARVYQGGLMHDIGKIGIRSSDLNQPGPLNWEQRDRFRMHPVYGRRIVEPMAALHPLIPAIYHHHEAYDGSGYPDGLAGEAIPLDARILSVADSYDAMTSDRAYRQKMSNQEARDELARCSGTQFDPLVVDAFLNMEELSPAIAQA